MVCNLLLEFYLQRIKIKSKQEHVHANSTQHPMKKTLEAGRISTCQASCPPSSSTLSKFVCWHNLEISGHFPVILIRAGKLSNGFGILSLLQRPEHLCSLFCFSLTPWMTSTSEHVAVFPILQSSYCSGQPAHRTYSTKHEWIEWNQ